MKPGTPGFVGARLREAREARGLSQIGFANLLGISRQAVSQYEANEITPGPQVMRTIADRLNMPITFFRTQGRELDLGTIFFRSMASEVRLQRARAKRRYAWLQTIADYVRDYVDLPLVDLPKLDLSSDPKMITTEHIENAASELRQYWQLGSGPISNVVWLLENRGVIIARDELGAIELDAFSSWVDGNPAIVLGSDKASAVRSRYDAGHELGHLILHRHVDEARLDRRGDFKLIESHAHRFAGAFLLPSESFAEDFWIGSIDELMAIKPKWRLSVGAMIHRAEDLELVPAEQARRLWRSRSRRGWLRQEPLDDELPIEQPQLLRRAFELMVGEGGLSREEILHHLPYPPTDIEDLAGLPHGTLQPGPIPLSLGSPRRDVFDDRPTSSADVVPFPGQADPPNPRPPTIREGSASSSK